jgi:DNA-directed RNA polymerase specialized sigma24 family protein
MSMFIERARGVLSEYEYEVFMLYIEGYSTAEISEKLGRDFKSVENAKSRMLKHLREESNVFSDI